MGRRYKRREFLTDAAVAATGSILLKVFAPPSSSTTVSSLVPATSNTAPISTGKVGVALPRPISDKG